MLDVFEQPWALLGASVIVFFGVLTFRSVCPDKRRWWHWLLPLGVAALGLGLDWLVATDLEKVTRVVKTAIKAVEEEDVATIATLIADDYEDSSHKSRAVLLVRCRNRLVPPAVESITRLATKTDITAPTATVTFTMLMKFDPNSFWARSYKSSALVSVKVYLRKRPDASWEVTRIEPLEVDKMPVNWGVT